MKYQRQIFSNFLTLSKLEHSEHFHVYTRQIWKKFFFDRAVFEIEKRYDFNISYQVTTDHRCYA